MEKEYVTKKGLEKLQKELEDRLAERKKIAGRIAEAKELGDLSENAEYHSAKEEFAFNEGRIGELEEMIKHAEIIHHRINHNIVSIGSTVKVKNGGKAHKYTIVGSAEADPLEGRISNESPIGRAFLGKGVGDEVEIKVPRGILKAKILAID